MGQLQRDSWFSSRQAEPLRGRVTFERAGAGARPLAKQLHLTCRCRHQLHHRRRMFHLTRRSITGDAGPRSSLYGTSSFGKIPHQIASISRGSARARRGLPAREFIGDNSAQSGKTVLGFFFARLGGAKRPFTRVERGRGPEEDNEEEKGGRIRESRMANMTWGSCCGSPGALVGPHGGSLGLSWGPPLAHSGHIGPLGPSWGSRAAS